MPDANDVRAEQARRTGVVGVVMRVDEVRHLVADAVRSGDLVYGPLDVVADGWGGVEQHHPVARGQERRVVVAVSDPVEIPLDSSDVVALVINGRPKRRSRNRRVVGQSWNG
jgi:hypothetical protein